MRYKSLDTPHSVYRKRQVVPRRTMHDVVKTTMARHREVLVWDAVYRGDRSITVHVTFMPFISARVVAQQLAATIEQELTLQLPNRCVEVRINP